MSPKIWLGDLTEDLQAQASEVENLFWGLHITLAVPAVIGVAAGVIPFVVCTLTQQVLEAEHGVAPTFLYWLSNIFLFIAFPATALVIVLLKKFGYNQKCKMAGDNIKNTLATRPELMEALEALKKRDSFINRQAELLGL